jgi:hypothetical protein
MKGTGSSMRFVNSQTSTGSRWVVGRFEERCALLESGGEAASSFSTRLQLQPLILDSSPKGY